MSPLLPTGTALRELIAAPRRAVIEAICVRLGEGRHASPKLAHLGRDGGLAGDRWSQDPRPGRQLTLIDARVVRLLLARRPESSQPELLARRDDELHLPGDNLVLDLPTGVASLPPGTRLRIGDGPVLEINDTPHLGCKKFEARFGRDALAWVNDTTHYDLRLRGIYADIVEDGDVRVGDALSRLPGALVESAVSQ